MEVAEKEVTLAELITKVRATFSYLWTQKIIISIAVITGAVLGLLYAIYKPVQYKSNVTFVVESASKSGGLGALGGLANSFGLGGVGGDGGLFENETNLMTYLKSKDILESVLLSELEHTGKTFAQVFFEIYDLKKGLSGSKNRLSINFKLGENREDFSLDKERILHEISSLVDEMIQVTKPEKQGSIIEIDITTRNDSLSKFFPEKLLSVVAERYTEMKTRLSKQTVDVLQSQTDSVRKVLFSSMHSAASSTDEVFGLNPAMAVKRVPAAKEQVDVQASTILLGELIKNLELSKMKLKDQTPLIEVIDSSRFPLEKVKAGKLKFTILFGFLFGIIVSLSLLARKFYQRIMTEG
jgi:hypothetical protein